MVLNAYQTTQNHQRTACRRSQCNQEDHWQTWWRVQVPKPFPGGWRCWPWSSLRRQWRRHGGGGKRGNLPPPPTSESDTPWDRCRYEEIFVSEKNGGRFTGFAPTFYMHRCYGGRSLVLRLRKKRELWDCWRSYSGRPSVKLRSSLGSFSPGIGPLKHEIFIYFLFLFLNVNLGPLPKNCGPNPMSFQFLTGGRLT